MLTVVPARIAGLVLVRPQRHADPRGFFVETYRADQYRSAGIVEDFVQDNHSRSARGTLRGLHFQPAPGQAKLVRVVRGAIFDVVVDIRRSSSTFGQIETFELDDRKELQLYVPSGFAHGFCVLSSEADVTYKASSYYDPALERGIAWDDPDLGIPWPISDPVLSQRDRRNPHLRELEAGFD